MTENSENQNVSVTLKISDNFLSEEFYTLLKMSEDVLANFESFQSYLKVTILACFVYGTLSHYSLPSFTAGILFFPGL